ncbi:hypothetical protein HYZ64_01315 [Candidatus Berkelbacteria bacterium]|nr:hypothetical protein [Candidatus Berkelbacteria bacterium]
MIAGVFVVVAIAGAYFAALLTVVNRKAPAQTGTQPATTNLEQEVIPLLEGLELNGQLPVTTSPEELGKDDPFAR